MHACDRLRLITDAVLMDEQGGFRVRRGCVDQIFAVRQVTEKVIEKDKVVYAAFADLEKAYDSVSRSKLWVALKDYGVKGKLLVAGLEGRKMCAPWKLMVRKWSRWR